MNAQAKPTNDDPQLRLWIVFDNNAHDGLSASWGFSCLVQVGSQRILFDTGADWSTLRFNMDQMGIDPTSIDAVVISHMHSDHRGGLLGLSGQCEGLEIYLPQPQSEALAATLEQRGHKPHRVAESTEVRPGMFTTGVLEGPVAEQGLIVQLDQGFVLICGCAHPGVDNMVEQARKLAHGKPLLVLGGFHLGKASSDEVKQIAVRLRELGVERISPCHCTGARATKLFEQQFGEAYAPCAVGAYFEL
ncbi:MAG: MBL fold metallo-hydrolase [Candidatus Alcyoniella australis]|nr:MBL fold metallo-hydrolase [Candidatus Alcyoniella australis]